MANIPMKTIKLPGLSDTYTFLQESDVRATAKDVTNTLIGYRPVGELEQINGNYNASGVWNNINDNYKHILIGIAPGDVIKMVAGSEQLNYGILAQPTTPTNNQAADDAPIAGYTGAKSIAAGNSVEIEAPATSTTLLIMSTYNGIVRDDYSLSINGLDYAKNVAENLGAFGASMNTVKATSIDRSALIDGVVDNEPVWARGTVPTSGVNRDSSSNTRFRTVNMLHNESELIVRTDGTYDTLLILFTESEDATTGEKIYTVRTSFGYSKLDKLIPENSYYRIVLCDGEDNTKVLPTADLPTVNDHVKIIDDRISQYATPGIKWIAMGDSITQGYVSTGESSTRISKEINWTGKMAHMKGWALNNIGQGGSGWVTNSNSDGSVWPQSATNAWYKATDPNKDYSFADYDVITLAYGLNDYKSGKAIGTLNGESGADYPQTIIGGMQKTLEAIIAENPKIKIFVILPMNCMGYKTGEALGTEATNWAIGYSYPGCGTLKEVHDAMISVCDYYGIEYIDQTLYSCINRKNIGTMLLDGVHPSEDAHTQIARELRAKISY